MRGGAASARGAGDRPARRGAKSCCGHIALANSGASASSVTSCCSPEEAVTERKEEMVSNWTQKRAMIVPRSSGRTAMPSSPNSIMPAPESLVKFLTSICLLRKGGFAPGRPRS